MNGASRKATDTPKSIDFPLMGARLCVDFEIAKQTCAPWQSLSFILIIVIVLNMKLTFMATQSQRTIN